MCDDKYVNYFHNISILLNEHFLYMYYEIIKDKIRIKILG